MELTDLPTEILNHIIAQISLNSDLARVVPLSRQFKTLAEPFLYRKVHLDADRLEECRPGSPPVLKRTDRLIANLKARPDLGKHTTSFSVRVTHSLWWQTDPHVSIMKRMPQLRQVSYDPPALHGASLPPECKRLSDLRLDFRHVTNHYDEDSGAWLEHGIPLQIVAKNLWHPTLRKLQAERLSLTPKFDYRFWLVEQRQRRGFPPVDDVRFLDCNPRIDYRVLSNFITTIKRLRCFVLDVSKPQRNPATTPLHQDDNPSDQIDLRPALDTHYLTIHTLALSTSDRALDVVTVSGSFVYWIALKRLALPYPEDRARHILLHKILPRQLEELQLEKRIWSLENYDNVLHQYEAMPENDLTQFLEFAENKRASVPALKRLTWWFQHPAGQRFEEANYRLLVTTVELFAGEVFGQVGVRFEVVATPYFRETPMGRRMCKW